MGVRNFNHLLKLVDVKESFVSYDAFKDRRIAVDANFIVSKNLSIARKILAYKLNEPDIEDQIVNLTVELFNKFCKTFTTKGIKLCLCFDKKGDDKVALLKARVKQERWESRDKNNEIYEENKEVEDENYKKMLFQRVFNSEKAKEVFRKIMDPRNLVDPKISIMVAGDYGNGILAEGEALASQLVHNNYAVAIYTNDSDAFAYGSAIVIRNHNKEGVFAICTKTILSRLKITLEQLQDICILSGIDYNVRSFPIKKAYNMIKTYGTINKFPKNLLEKVDPSWDAMRDILRSVKNNF